MFIQHEVPSRSHPGHRYVVFWQDWIVSCSCKGFQWRGHCRHGDLVAAHEFRCQDAVRGYVPSGWAFNGWESEAPSQKLQTMRMFERTCEEYR